MAATTATTTTTTTTPVQTQFQHEARVHFRREMPEIFLEEIPHLRGSSSQSQSVAPLAPVAHYDQETPLRQPQQPSPHPQLQPHQPGPRERSSSLINIDLHLEEAHVHVRRDVPAFFSPNEMPPPPRLPPPPHLLRSRAAVLRQEDRLYYHPQPLRGHHHRRRRRQMAPFDMDEHPNLAYWAPEPSSSSPYQQADQLD